MSLHTEDDCALHGQCMPLAVLTWPWVSILVEDNGVCLLKQEESECFKIMLFFSWPVCTNRIALEKNFFYSSLLYPDFHKSTISILTVSFLS